VSYSKKTNVLRYEYQLCHAAVTRTSSTKGIGVFFDSKLYFHKHAVSLFYECIHILSLIRSVTFRLSSLDWLYVLYFTLVRSKLEYASVVRNSITSTDATKLDHMQQKFASDSFCRLYHHIPYSHTFGLEKLSLPSSRKRRHHLVALFFVHFYRGLKSCTSILENVSLRVPTRNVGTY
jgi:hypothetical protein